ncbi:hypothetical protein CRUP_026410, partial [Coryphaenoides rupestris]
AIEPAPKIDGRHRSTITLQENVTHRFKCHSDGWDPRAPPLLTWYLNGKRQNNPAEQEQEQEQERGHIAMEEEEEEEEEEESRVVRRFRSRYRSQHNSTFALRARKWDRELVCAAANPHTGESYNATVTLNVQYPSDLSLVLFALVRSNPPATITFVDQSGQMVANTSDFLILDSRSYPWLANHTLKVTLSSLSGNVSMNASNSVGTAQSNLTLAATLKTEKVDKAHLPRENMSLPSNMQLNDLCTLRRAREAVREVAKRRSLGEERRWPDHGDDELTAAYAARGFSRYPMVGYIYKVNSTSSEEIWL